MTGCTACHFSSRPGRMVGRDFPNDCCKVSLPFVKYLSVDRARFTFLIPFLPPWMCRPLARVRRFLSAAEVKHAAASSHSTWGTRGGRWMPQWSLHLHLLDLDTLVSMVTELAANVLPFTCPVWGKVNLWRVLPCVNTHQCLLIGRQLLTGNNLECRLLYGTVRMFQTLVENLQAEQNVSVAN